MFRNTLNALGALGLLLLSCTAIALPPVAAPPNPDSATFDEDFNFVADLSAIFSDPEGDPITYSFGGATAPAIATVSVNPTTGLVNFTAIPDANGTQTFTFEARDDNDPGVGTFTFILTYTPINDAPVAVADVRATTEDTTLNVAAPGVLGNDSDIDGDALTAVLDTDVSNGTLTLNGDGSFSYTPNADFNGADSFTYHANDGTASSSIVTVTLNVAAGNDAPVAVADVRAATEDTTLNVAAPGVLGNDSDIDGDALTAVLDTDVSNGTLTLNGDGSFSYTPNADFNGADSFTYHANDGTASSSIVTVTLNVAAVNDAPVAVADVNAATEDTTLNVAAPGVLGNDSDIDGDALTAVLDTDVSNGTLNLNGSGSFTYTPNADFNGVDSFSYHANDGTASSSIVTVTLNVAAVNDAPLAVADFRVATEDTALNVAAPGVLGNDSDVEGDPLTAVLNTNVSNGTLTLNGNGSFTYTPSLNFNGVDSFTYHANDGSADSSVVTVTLSVAAVNDAPLAVADVNAATEDTTLNVAAPGVLGNDSDVDGNPLSAVLDTGVGNGTLTLNGNGSFTYTPNLNFNGVDSFTYHANDGTASSNIVTVTLNVAAVNDAPVAVADVRPATEDTVLNVAAPGVLGNDSDVEGDPLTAVLNADVSNGTLVLNGDGSFNYTPNLNFNGADSFTYHANDGTADSSIVTVTLNVAAVNDAPVAVGDVRAATEDTTLNVPAPGVLTNDSDVDGDVLSAVLDTDVSNGTLTLNGNGSFSYVPDLNFNGVDSFTYHANDGTVNSGIVTVTLNVGPVNDAPVAVADVRAATEDTTLNVAAPGVLGNDSDVDADPLTAVLDADVNKGTLVLNGDGSFTYTPNLDSNGVDSFTYHATDGTLDSNVVTVTLNVAPVDDPTVAVADTGSTTEDTVLNVAAPGVLANDIDVDGDPLTVVLDVDVSNGTLLLNGDGSYTYTPSLNFNGADAFTYHVDDGVGSSNVVSVDLTVTPVPDDPVVAVAPPAVVTDEDSPGTATSLAGVFDDPDIALNGDSLTLTVTGTSGSPIDTATMAGDTLNVTYLPDQNGPATITVRATDTTSRWVEATVNVTVNPVNDDPIVAGPVPVITTNEDSGGTFTSLVDVFDDVDIATNADSLSLSVTGTSGTAIDTAVMAGQTLNVTYLPNENGTGTVTVRATDSMGAWVEATINVNVVSINDVPVVVGSVSDITVDEDSSGSSIDFSGVFDDVDIATDSDVLTLTVQSTTGTAIGTASMAGNTLNITYLADRNGPGSVNVRATDTLGAWVEYTLNVTVNPVNDSPYVANPIADISNFEDNATPTVIDLSTVFDDVDIATNGDVLTYSLVSNSNPSLFASVTPTGNTLTITLALDQNGTATFVVQATDLAGLSVTDTFVMDVAGVNDFPVPADDTVAMPMNEDDPFISIPVMANDYKAETPTVINSAGVNGGSESPPTIVIDPFGDAIADPNGTVRINNNVIEYEPKPNFYGTDYFTYTIIDSDGDVSPPATVTITVTSVNDPPVGIQERTYSMIENGSLTVPASDGVFVGAYDVDGKLLDGSGNEIGSPLSAVVTSLPAVGTLNFDGATGAFDYTPPINFTGDVSFSYRLFDGIELSATPDYVVRIVVNPAPPPPAPPPAGQVAITYNISNVPLEQSSSVPPNVLVVMDDSGSMDWNVIVAGPDENGGFVLDNSAIATKSQRAGSYVYLADLNSNAYPPNSAYGQILPTEAALAANTNTDNNQYGVWRARTPLMNTMYYNPAVRYTPWRGQDANNIDFADAVPTAIRLDPVDASSTFDLLAAHSYTANAVPRWEVDGGTTNVAVTNLYLPRYYTTSATPPLQWNDPHTLVEIKVGSGPLAGDMFPGGPNREDCAVGDSNPLDCSYAEEIQNFANWFQYYRTREYVTKNGMGKVIAEVQDIRVGYETISATTSRPIRLMNELYTQGDKKALLDNIYKVDSYGGTPLRQALGRAGQIFSCSTGGDCPALPAPDGTCQQNFALLFSDGYWNGGTGVATNDDIDGAGPFDGGVYADSVAQTLADVAMNYYETDLFPTVANEVPVSRRDLQGAPAGTFSGADDTMHQHMKTYAIAFGVNGTIEPTVVPADPTTAFSWPDPFDGSLEKIDDMLHAATNGRGEFLNARNPQELQVAFEQAFLEFTQAASSTSAAAFNSTSLRDGTLLYRGFYDLRDNTGELTATIVNTDGTLAATPTWRASEQLDPANKLPGDRILVTTNPVTGNGVPFRHTSLAPQQQITISQDEVNFIRGDRSNELPSGYLRERLPLGGLLGDIVNSSPVFVGEPRAINRDQAPYPITDLYSDFAAARASRTPIVYVGANDGILHGFNAQTGVEAIGYVPNKILDSAQRYRNLLNNFASPFYLHKYYVDLTPRFNDVYMHASRVAVAKTWNTVLVGGLGAGGKGFFALNVTDPGAQFTSELTAAGSVLWEFTDSDDTYPVDAAGVPLGGAVGALTDPDGQPVKDLGVALSLPTVAMSNVSDGGSPAQKEWVAIFGNGPNSTAGIAKLFVLFMDRGLNGWGDADDFVKLDTGYGVPSIPDQQAGFPNGLGTPTVVDRDLNGTADWVYAGDRLGHLFRFDISDPDPDNWTTTLLFSATYFDGTIDRVQPILSKPEVVKHPTEDGFLIIFGTGSHIAKEDANSEEVQSIYAIWDRGELNPATALADSKSLRLVEQTMTNVVDDSVSPAQTRRALSRNAVNYAPESGVPGTYGWYIDLDMPRATNTVSGAVNPDTSGHAPPDPQFPGEKAIRRMVFRGDSIVTTTVLPSTGETSCFGARPGSVLVFDVLTGGDAKSPVVDFNNDGVIDSGDLVQVGGSGYAAGLLFNQDDLDGTLVDLSTLGGEGDMDFLFISGGNSTTSFRIEDIDDSRTGRLSWREIDDAN